ncbi:D-alanyl-D-alanine carboxypeptidase DacA [Pantoea sp. Mhis]|uniref:D-alanyl-D-alanine carboxypeptidase DacA n=1 Tax=Pantoea sp. Mhis TaxID=2576759 RepID=UPI00135C1684|nr:D-alanyl-D-alanine carboxypeptidase DacA [Pantoea sp. Mhis]
MRKLKSYHFILSILLEITIVFTFSHFAIAANNNLDDLIPSKPDIDAAAYILIDYHSGKVLAEKNADIRRSPASLTKMMTSYIVGSALKEGKIHQNDMVTVDKDAWATGNPIFKGSSLMFLKPGDQVTVYQLRRGIVLQSGNDACVAMADYIAGSQNVFVDMMNRYVHLLGLKNTHFQTVHGLDADDQYSSARDMALIGQALIRDVPEEYAVYREKEFTFNNIRQINRNGLLWDKNFNVDGIKTGHTDTAGYNLVVSATKNQMRLICAVLGAHTYKKREKESKKLLTWGFRFFETVLPLKAEKEVVSKSVWFSNNSYVQLGVNKDVYVTIPRGRMNDLKINYVLNNSDLYAPLQKNQIVGTIKFQLDNYTVQQRSLLVLNEVQKGGIINRIIDSIKLKVFKWFK